MTDNLLSMIAGDLNDQSQLGRTISRLAADIQTFGIQPVYETDFNDYRETVIACSDRGTITGVFDSERCPIGPENGFWIRGVDGSGHTVHAQAIRYDDLGISTLADHWLGNLELFAPTGMDFDIDRTNLVTAPASHEISGGVCYHGDFWMDRSARKYGLAPLLSNFAQRIAVIKFSPDFLYCLMVPKLIKKGWAAQQGYLHTHPWAPSWHIRGENEPFDEYLAWLTSRELDDLWHPGKRDGIVPDGVRQTNEGRSPVREITAGH